MQVVYLSSDPRKGVGMKREEKSLHELCAEPSATEGNSDSVVLVPGLAICSSGPSGLFKPVPLEVGCRECTHSQSHDQSLSRVCVEGSRGIWKEAIRLN